MQIMQITWYKIKATGLFIHIGKHAVTSLDRRTDGETDIILVT
jgi:hypothetical protein